MKKITLISFLPCRFRLCFVRRRRVPGHGHHPGPQQVTWGEGAFRMPAKLLYTTDLDGQDKADLAAWMQRAADGFFPASFAEASDGDMPALELLRTGDGARKLPSRRLPHKDHAHGPPMPQGCSTDSSRSHNWPGTTAAAFRPSRSWTPRASVTGASCSTSRAISATKEFVERQLDLMARYKLNRFHWHLTDGAGWRIEIKKYPALTDIAAWRPYPDWEGWNFGGKRYCHRDDPAAAGAITRRTTSAKWSNTPVPCISR